MPRYYTIASSNLKYPDKLRISISLTKNIVDYPDHSKRAVYGFAS